MKLAEKIEYIQTTNLSMWLETRTKVFEELSDKQQFMCKCGRLPSTIHNDRCKKFYNEVTSETVKRLKHLLPITKP